MSTSSISGTEINLETPGATGNMTIDSEGNMVITVSEKFQFNAINTRFKLPSNLKSINNLLGISNGEESKWIENPSLGSRYKLLNTWTTITTPEPGGVNRSWSGLSYNPLLNRFVIGSLLGDGQDSIAYSSDGKSWISVASPDNTKPIKTIDLIEWGGAPYFFAGINVPGTNNLFRSINGTSWSAVDTNLVANSFAYNKIDNVVVACNDQGTGQIFNSTDVGLTWTLRHTGAGNVFNKVVYAPELEIFCANSLVATTPQFVVGDKTGTVWTPCSPVASVETVTSLAWSGKLGIFCAIGKNTTDPNFISYTSPDGINWTKNLIRDFSPSFNSPQTLLWVDELELFVIGNSLHDGNAIYLSKDAITWTSCYTPLSYNGLDPDLVNSVWSPELGVVVFIRSSNSGGSNGLISLS